MQTSGSESFEDGVPFYPFLLGQPPPIAEHPLAWDQQHRVTFQAFGVFRHVPAVAAGDVDDVEIAVRSFVGEGDHVNPEAGEWR